MKLFGYVFGIRDSFFQYKDYCPFELELPAIADKMVFYRGMRGNSSMVLFSHFTRLLVSGFFTDTRATSHTCETIAVKTKTTFEENVKHIEDEKCFFTTSALYTFGKKFVSNQQRTYCNLATIAHLQAQKVQFRTLQKGKTEVDEDIVSNNSEYNISTYVQDLLLNTKEAKIQVASK